MQALNSVALATCLFAVSSSVAAPFPISNKSAPAARVAPAATIEAFQEYAQAKKCKLNPCILTFPTVTDTQILIQHISCTFGLKTGGTLEFVYLGKTEADDFDTLSANKNAINPNVDFYMISAQANFFVNNGQAPQVTVLTLGKNPEALRCTISGQHVPQSA